MGKQNKKCLGQMQTKYIMISHTRIVKIAKKVGQKINRIICLIEASFLQERKVLDLMELKLSLI